MSINVGQNGISPELVKLAQQALKNDQKIDDKELKEIKALAAQDGNITKEEIIFIDNLKNEKLTQKLMTADFNPNQKGLSFDIDAADKKPVSFDSLKCVFQTYMNNGKLAPAEVYSLYEKIDRIKDPVDKTWMKLAVDTIMDGRNHKKGPDGEIIPNNKIVANLISDKSIEILNNAKAEAAKLPMLNNIKDPAAKELFKEAMTLYMADSVFNGVFDSAWVGVGATTNLFQSLAWVGEKGASLVGAGDPREVGGGSVDGRFGSCVECRGRMETVFRQAVKSWEERNPGKECPLKVSGATSDTAFVFEHNFVGLTLNDGGTPKRFIVDPWGSQKADPGSIKTLDDYVKDNNHKFFSAFMTAKQADGQHVYSPVNNTAGLEVVTQMAIPVPVLNKWAAEQIFGK